VTLRFAVTLVVALVLPLSAGGAAGPLVVFRATTHTPKVNTKWPWSFTVTKAGRPIAGTVTAQVIDPIGGVHAVEFGAVKKKFVTNIGFKGRFGDFVVYPPISQGVKVTFRVTVRTAFGKRVVNYWVQAR
jgi:hypothetical protein